MNKDDCRTTETRKKLDIKFQSYSDGSVKNQFGVSVYKVNSVLFQLENAKQLTTIWGELLPDAKLKKSGHYFIKESKKL